MTAVRLAAIRKSFGDKLVLDGLDFTVGRAEVMAVNAAVPPSRAATNQRGAATPRRGV